MFDTFATWKLQFDNFTTVLDATDKHVGLPMWGQKIAKEGAVKHVCFTGVTLNPNAYHTAIHFAFQFKP